MLHCDGAQRLVPDSSDWDRSPTGTPICPSSCAFNWGDCLDGVGPGDWYLVAFRSVRRPDADEARLCEYDDWAHRKP